MNGYKNLDLCSQMSMKLECLRLQNRDLEIILEQYKMLNKYKHQT